MRPNQRSTRHNRLFRSHIGIKCEKPSVPKAVTDFVSTLFGQPLIALSHLAQIGAVFLGVYAYFNTVVPVLQKERLEEQAVQLTREKAKAENDLKMTLAQQATLSSELKSLEANLNNTLRSNASLLSAVSDHERNEYLAKSRLKAVAVELDAERKSVDLARWELLLLVVRAEYQQLQNSFSTRLYSLLDSRGNEPPDQAKRLAALQSDWLVTQPGVLRALDNVASRREPNIPIPYIEAMKKLVVQKASLLACEQPNFEEFPGFLQENIDYVLGAYASDFREGNQRLEAGAKPYTEAEIQTKALLMATYRANRRLVSKLEIFHRDCEGRALVFFAEVRREIFK